MGLFGGKKATESPEAVQLRKELRKELQKAKVRSAGNQQGCGCLLFILALPLLLLFPPLGGLLLIVAIVILIIGFIPR
jgi:hypothetical protein